MKTIRLSKDDVYNLIKSHKEGISVFEIEEQLTGKSQEVLHKRIVNEDIYLDNRVTELQSEGKIFYDEDIQLWLADVHLTPERQDELCEEDEQREVESEELGEQIRNMTHEERNELLGLPRDFDKENWK